MRRRADWQSQGLCREEDKAYLFIEYIDGTSTLSKTQQYEKMRAICDQCPVKADCLSYAVVHEAIGFWGGTSESERRKIRSQNLEVLGYRAAKEGWLEDHHLMSQEVALEAFALVGIVETEPLVPPSPQELEQAHHLLEEAVDLAFDFLDDPGLQ